MARTFSAWDAITLNDRRRVLVFGCAPDYSSTVFSEAIFDRLGYFGVWLAKNRSMHEAFESAGVSYGAFLCAANRNNPFMFTRISLEDKIALTD